MFFFVLIFIAFTTISSCDFSFFLFFGWGRVDDILFTDVTFNSLKQGFIEGKVNSANHESVYATKLIPKLSYSS